MRERLRTIWERFLYGGYSFKATPLRVFLFTTLVFGTVFSLPRYSRTDVGVLEPFDPVSGMLGGMCLAAVITAVWAVFRSGSD